MRQKASTVGNIVGKGVPISTTEVRTALGSHGPILQLSSNQDNNVTLRTWDPTGELTEPAAREGIIPHHEVLLRLDAMDLDRGGSCRPPTQC